MNNNGTYTENNNPYANNELCASTTLKVLCVFIPLLGILLYAFNITKYPKFANECLWSSFFLLHCALFLLIIYFGICLIMEVLIPFIEESFSINIEPQHIFLFVMGLAFVLSLIWLIWSIVKNK